MKFSELECCPFCGGEEFYEKQRASGTIVYRYRFDGDEADNTDMYDGVYATSNGRVYCEACDRYLGNYDNDVVSATVAKKLGVSR